MSSRLKLGFAAVALSTALGCHPQKAQPVAASAPPAPETGIDDSALDRAAAPCDDFYEYACGGWLKKTEIPADRADWMRSFNVIDDENAQILKSALEEAAAAKAPTPMNKQLGDLWAACIDEDKIEKSSKAELDALLKPIDAVKDMPTLAKELAREHLGIGGALFGFGQEQDLKDSTVVIGKLDQGGLGLPDRDYYTVDDPKMEQLRSLYVAHVEKMLGLAGAAPDVAKAQAQTVMKIETDLAKVSMTRADHRLPEKTYNRLELKGLVKRAPKFPWAVYLKELGIPQVTQIDVQTPAFFVALGKMLPKTPIADWRTYLRWQMVHAAAPLLSKAFVDENFAFYDKTLSGTEKILPRWKRCVAVADHLLGESLAQVFVQKTFGADGKKTSLEMIAAIEKAMEKNLGKLSWMDEATRKAAIAKLAAITNKIGYPDSWRDYSTVKIGRESFLADVQAGAEFENRRQLAKIGRPVDRTEWDMTPPTVNAYYEPSKNEMVFPAGILQPPFYNRKALDAVNFGAIGMVMGHELTHGFDDEGRKYDGKGNLTQWWTPATNAEFEKRAKCVVDQYNGYEVVPGANIDGKLTIGENIADLGGIKLAYGAFQASHKPSAKRETSFTDEQLFFLGTAQAWCGKRRPESELVHIKTDEHSTPKYRINGPLSNLPEFAAAFQCKPGSRMVRSDACVIW